MNDAQVLFRGKIDGTASNNTEQDFAVFQLPVGMLADGDSVRAKVIFKTSNDKGADITSNVLKAYANGDSVTLNTFDIVDGDDELPSVCDLQLIRVGDDLYIHNPALSPAAPFDNQAPAEVSKIASVDWTAPVYIKLTVTLGGDPDETVLLESLASIIKED